MTIGNCNWRAVRLRIYDKRVIDELRDFVWDAHGKPCAETGRHDDCVMALGGAIQLHQRCPYNEDTYEFLNEREQEDNIKTVSVMGSYDIDPDDEDDETDNMYDDMSEFDL